MKKDRQFQRINSLTPEYYINQIQPNVFDSFNPDQIHEVKRVLTQAIPKPSPKIVDLRFTVDLILSRFYVVVFVGQDRRQGRRNHSVTKATKVGNFIAATLLLIGLNLLISTFIFLLLYLLKSAVGINLFEGHLIDQIKKF
ncbi:MAG: hypothetical protein WBA77_01745 [Microcoleaceae cyanobacterium]